MECHGILYVRRHASAPPVDAFLLSLAIASAGAPILIADVDDCVVWVNRAFSELGGAPAEMGIGNFSASFGCAASHKKSNQGSAQ